MEVSPQLHRTESFKKAFLSWKEGVGRYVVMRKVREMYERAMLEQGGADCDILRTPGYSMFILHPMQGWETDIYRFLMDHWKDLVLMQGYYTYLSDNRN